MQHPRFLLLFLIPVLLAGCQTVNQQDRTVLREHGVSPDVYDKMVYGDPLSLADVIELSHRAVPAALIIHYMDKTDTAYRLRKADVQHLRSAGVSEDVISYMLSTSAPYAGPPYAGGYPPPPYPYPYAPYDYYYGAYDGPVVVVGGGGYGGYHRWGGGGGWGYHHYR
jgi:hypothetical protein